METPISPSSIEPIKPDTRPRMDMLVSKINFEVSQKSTFDEIKVDVCGLFISEEEMKTLVSLYEPFGWFCYFESYLTMFDRNYMVLRKNPFDRVYYFIKDKEIKTAKLGYLLPYYGFLKRADAELSLGREIFYEKKSTPTKSWFKKLFG